MASPYRDGRNSKDFTMEFPSPSSNTTASGTQFYGNQAYYKVPEPVTPPMSVQSGGPQLAKSHYFTPHFREKRKPSVSYSTTVLASPIDTPRTSFQTSPGYPGFPTSLHQPQLQQQLPSVQLQQSLPSPQPLQPLQQMQSSHFSMPTTPNTAPIWQEPTLTHARSYSYTPLDFQSNMNRLSISSTSSSGSQDGLRPRAYSFGVSNNITPFGIDGAAQVAAAANPFPPPLSSPLSPENLGVSHRMSFPSLHSSKRSSPPQSRLLGKSRSSSSGSSVDFTAGSAGISRSGSFSSLAEGAPSASASASATATATTTGTATATVTGTKTQPSSITGSVPIIGSAILASSSVSGGGSPAAANSGGASSSMNGSATGTSGAAAGSASALSASSTNMSTMDIIQAPDDQIYALCRDQRGCRFLQRKLAEADHAVCRRVFDATHAHIVALMMDPFGNYFCQKLFEHCTPADVTRLLRVSAPSLPAVAVNQHGTRALQKLIDAITAREQVDLLIYALDGHVVRLIRDLNGNHVIQKLLLTLDERGSQFIYDAACESVVEIGSHRHGCCVLQRCLDYAQETSRVHLIEHIVDQALVLVRDPFGNYVCQYVIDLGVQEYTDAMVRRMLGKICELSVQKFSSNVVEKCFRAASPPLQHALLAEIMEPSTFHELVMDNYGNYVIQTALESTKSLDSEVKRQLAASIQTALMVTRSPYGRRILSKLKSW